MVPHIRSPQTRLLIAWLVIIALLITLGIIFIYSSSSIFAMEHYHEPHYFVLKQLMGLIIGLGGLVICRRIPFHTIQRFSPYLFLAAAGITALTLVPQLGVMIHGSRRWIAIAGISFQPSEFLKIAFIIYLAYILTKKQYHVRSFMYGYAPFLLIIGITAIILLQQPDFGQAITLGITAFMLFFIAHIHLAYLVGTLALVFPLIGVLIYFKPYRFQRILIFLNPWKDPQGAGFQIIQSLIAIGSGNVTGVGIAQSKQKFFYLPMQHTDFIFSIIAEETGFIGSCVIIFLYCSFLVVGLKLATKISERFSCYLILGYIFLVTIQAIMNICVTTGLLPTKGLGLPFISFGNSALIAHLCMIGVIINAVHASHASTTSL